MASEKAPTNIKGISKIADGINHSVPTHKELQSSFTWLMKNGFVSKIENKYTLTSKGKNEYKIASEETNIIMEIWNILEQKMRNDA